MNVQALAKFRLAPEIISIAARGEFLVARRRQGIHPIRIGPFPGIREWRKEIEKLNRSAVPATQFARGTPELRLAITLLRQARAIGEEYRFGKSTAVILMRGFPERPHQRRQSNPDRLLPARLHLVADGWFRPTDEGFLLESPSSGTRALLLSGRWTMDVLRAASPEGLATRSVSRESQVILRALWEAGILVRQRRPSHTASETHEFLQASLHRALLRATDRAWPETPQRANRDAMTRHLVPQVLRWHSLPGPRQLPSRPLVELGRSRRSRRGSTGSLSLADLSDWLFRTFGPTRATNPGGLIRWRAFPSAGGVHEIECLLSLPEKEHLPAGLYFYDSRRHRLGELPIDPREHSRLREQAHGRWALQLAAPLDTLALLLSDLPRLRGKYGSLSYPLTWLDAGCALQQACLTAADLGIEACPLGPVSGRGLVPELRHELDTPVLAQITLGRGSPLG